MWVSATDTSGHPYYYHTQTGERSWSLPDGEGPIEWSVIVAESGHPYYYHSGTGATSWSLPASPEPPDLPPAPIKGRILGTIAAIGMTRTPPPPPAPEARAVGAQVHPAAPGDDTAGIAAKIDALLLRLRTGRSRYIVPDPAFLRPWKMHGIERPLCEGVAAWPRLLCAFAVYGILFVPFTFAVLQQAMIDRKAIDPFGTHTLSDRVWMGGFAFLLTAFLYVVILFTALADDSRWYRPGSVRLSLLLLSVVGLVLLQQLLALRYILMRKDLSVLHKDPGARKYTLVGRWRSSMNPRNWVNYIYASVIVAEFFQFAAIIFHPRIPWLMQGGGDAFSDSLQNFLPRFIAGSFTDLLITVLLLLVTIYVLMIGEFVYAERPPSSPNAVVIREFFAQTCYVFVAGRLVSVAGGPGVAPGGRMVAMLAFFVFCTTATFVASLRDEQPAAPPPAAKGEPDVRFLPLFLVAEALLKGLLAISATVVGNFDAPFYDDFAVAIVPVPAPNGTALGAVVVPAVPSKDDALGGPIVMVLLALVLLGVQLLMLRRWRTCSVM